MLSEKNIPSMKIVSDYSQEDSEQIKIRMESFKGVVENRRTQ
jgi:benzoyl-CoA reductase/2-hydroxyglutaryl-CoA dehydratase subunit BcrC/BadD/HgdB